METSASIIIKKETIQRLLKDVKQIMKQPLTDNGIYYCHDENNILKGYAMIVGPSDTPYFGGYYFFKFDYPADYPYSPPKVLFMTNDGFTRYNPNLYKCGKVCVSILNTWSGEKWSSCQTLNSILLTLCSLLNENPLQNEPGINSNSPECISYRKTIEYQNISFAICDMINPCKNTIPSDFKIFEHFIKENFFKNYDKLLEIVESKKDINETYITSIYSMKTTVDYIRLKKKLIETRGLIETIS
jgi:ubiquitin-protein ligase